MTIETKYNIGDEVWVSNFGTIYRGLIVEISITINRGGIVTLYKVEGDAWRALAVTEFSLFPTKEELLKSL